MIQLYCRLFLEIQLRFQQLKHHPSNHHLGLMLLMPILHHLQLKCSDISSLFSNSLVIISLGTGAINIASSCSSLNKVNCILDRSSPHSAHTDIAIPITTTPIITTNIYFIIFCFTRNLRNANLICILSENIRKKTK